MIKPEHLRIGNEFEYFIEDKFEGNEWVRNVIDVEDIAYCVGHNESFNKNYRPVPLSPAILEKCGFEKCGLKLTEYKLYTNEIDDECIYINNIDTPNEYEVCYHFDKETILIKRKIQYLHTFQNLYHSLTQTELIFKP